MWKTLGVLGFGLFIVSYGEAQEVVDVEVRGELRKVAESLILTTVGLQPGIELSQGTATSCADL